MKKAIIFIIFLFTLVVFAQKESLVSPYPGGSPFPPGSEPSLTHIAKAFWTTQDGFTTNIKIKAQGDRATQLNGWVWNKDKNEGIIEAISL